MRSSPNHGFEDGGAVQNESKQAAAPSSGDDGAKTLSVEEAAKALGIGRNKAYELANLWLDTGGEEGIPALRLGRLIRIPRSALDQMLASGGAHRGQG